MKAIVVYYSLEGNTDFAAREIARRLGARLLRLLPKKTYPTKGFRKFFWGGKSAVMAETPALEPYDFSGAEYDLVILGFPVWASSIAPPIRTFLKENDLRQKRLAAFACQSGSGAEKAFGKLLNCVGAGDLERTLVLIDPKDKPCAENDEKIKKFCEALEKAGS